MEHISPYGTVPPERLKKLSGDVDRLMRLSRPELQKWYTLLTQNVNQRGGVSLRKKNKELAKP